MYFNRPLSSSSSSLELELLAEFGPATIKLKSTRWSRKKSKTSSIAITVKMR